MPGPTSTEVQQLERQRRNGNYAGSYEDEEPWDQRRRPTQQQQVDCQYPSLDEEEGSRSANPSNNSSRNDKNGNSYNMIGMKTRAAGVASTGRAAVKIREEDFDDGDLPSLSTSAGKSRASLDPPYATPLRSDAVLERSSVLQPPPIKTTRALKTGSRSAVEKDWMQSGERRKFWGQMEKDGNGDHLEPSRQKNRVTVGDEADGPDDEVAARRTGGKHANNNKKQSKRSAADGETPVQDDNDAMDIESIPTDVESQISEEELEEEDQYDASFCGQTLRVLDDMCGSKLNLMGSEGETKAQRISKSPENVETTLVPRRPDVQQEHTAIEVEFVEPLAKKSSGNSKDATTKDATTSSDVSGKKNAYLNAMAKRAKENFRKKKKKDPGKGDYVNPASPLENGEEDALTSDRETVTAAGSARALEQRLSLSETGSFDDDYNTFSPAEKLKFVKLINSGLSALDATVKVKEDRKMANELAETAAKEAARLPVWKHAPEHAQIRPSKASGSDMYSAPGDEQDTESEVEVNYAADVGNSLADEITEPESVKIYSDRRIGDFPFQKSGINYYDAVRREQNVDDDSLDQIPVPKKPWHDPNKSHRKFSLPGKPKGFSALNDGIGTPDGKLANIVVQSDDTQLPGLLLADLLTENRLDEHISKEAGSGIDTVSTPGMSYPTIADHENKIHYRSIVLSAEEESVAEKQGNLATAVSSVEERVANLVSSEDAEGISREPAFAVTEVKQQSAVSPVTSDDEESSPKVIDSLFRAPIRKKLAGYQKVGSAAVPSTLPEGVQANESDPALAYPGQQENVASLTLHEDLEMYFGSEKNAVTSGSFGSPSISDNVSVYTVGTNVTGTSSYTTSSRVRRPGAAKMRLAKQKQIEEEVKKKRNGWHESIKAAAESTNRVWNPKKGWVDYIGPEDDTLAEPNPEDKSKLRVDLSRSIISPKEMDPGGNGTVSAGEAVPIPFPKEWEMERKDMAGVPANNELSALSAPAEVGVELSVTDANGQETSGDTEVEIDVDDPSLADYTSVGGVSAGGLDEQRSNIDWVESMRAASAALAPKGKSWDPVHGWRSTTDNGSIVPESVDFSTQPTADPSSMSETRAVPMEQDSKIDPQIKSRADAMPIYSDPASQLQLETTPPTLIDYAAKMLRAETATVNDSTVPQTNPDQLASLSMESKSKISPVLQARLQSLSQLGIDTAAKASPMLQSRFKSLAQVITDASKNATPASLPIRNDTSTDSSLVSNFQRGARVPVESNTPKIGGLESGDKYESPGLLPLQVVDTRSMEPIKSIDTALGYTINDDGDTGSTGSAPVIDTNLDDFDKPMSPIVSVVKQKIGREDFNLFSEEGPRKNRSMGHLENETASHEVNGSGDHRTRLVVAAETPRSNISIVSRDRSIASTSTRRGRSIGPIDVDEVDETWDSEGEGFEKFSNAGNISVNRSILSGGSTASKPVPKLARSKRDTSPVHGEKSAGTSSSETVGSQATPVERRRSPRTLRGPVPIGAIEESDGFAVINDPTEPAENELVHQGPPNISDDENDRISPQSMTGDDTVPHSPSVKERMQQWETRIETKNSADGEEKKTSHSRTVADREKQPFVGLAGWKSFLGKKVEDESAAAAAAGRSANSTQTNPKLTGDSKSADDDSLYVFNERRQRTTQTKGTQADLNLSDISPIQANDDQYDSEEMEEAESEAYGPTSDQRQVSSIFKRLSECAAPMMPARMSPTSGGAGRFLPPVMCGRPDIDEPDSTASSAHSSASTDRHMRSASFGDDKPKANHPFLSKTQRDLPVSNSSVVSEDFGAKTAYLEALAMKTAVSKPKRTASARRERSSASSVVSSSTVHSERWREFLERKKATGTSARTSDSGVSRAAERYASEKVDEIMSKMASRSKSVARSRDLHKEYNYVDAGFVYDDEAAQSKTTSVQAAQDLAAARVEAMMVALSNPELEQMEEAEI